MKKFIAAFDGLHYSVGTEQYAIQLAKECNAHLVGVFLDDFMRHSWGVNDLVSYDKSFEKHRMELYQKDTTTRTIVGDYFKDSCQEAGITFSIHHDRNIAVQELIHESIFADLIFINETETLTRYEETSPSRFLREVLTEVHCPVIVVPDKYAAPEKVLFFYDGEFSSVYAIKMFSYLLPELKSLQLELITVRGDESQHIADSRLLKEFMKRHFVDITYTILEGDPDQSALQHLSQQKKNCLAVAGAYGRGRISRWRRKSWANMLINQAGIPLFIAHDKS